jgi:hypothetical protein
MVSLFPNTRGFYMLYCFYMRYGLFPITALLFLG